MKSKITVAIIPTLLFRNTLAAESLPSATSSELTWLQASPVHLQVLGLGNLMGADPSGATTRKAILGGFRPCSRLPHMLLRPRRRR